ncbi:efflux RND transporter permease subunit [Agaribacterium haliotis]|uniref:efflux RND transporter permease subunit n=1 Tax=Agaribacterium haliotis TaxID=2013869 RepID=UPI000BB57E22|nr:efflux RND transporter permease subunit [Agaribacterium haliotis]
MKFTDIFIRRPVLSIVVSMLILIAGLQAAMNLTVRQYPESDSAVISIQTVYVGASAELVQGFITTPIERAISSADGIDYVESVSALGYSTVNAVLKLNYDPVRAMSEISAKVNQIRGELPPEAEIPALTITSPDEEVASAYLSFSSDVLSQSQITDYLVRAIQPRLSALPGVQKADILGGRTFAMRAWLKPENMAAYKVSPAEVYQALAVNNVQSTLGQTKGALTQVNLSANTDLRTVEDFRKLIVRQSPDGTIRLEDIADVELGAQDYNTVVNYSGKTAIFMGVWVLPTANALDVIADVKKEMDLIQAVLPSGLDAELSYDATAYIAEAITEVTATLIETLIIITIVIFLFLGFSRSVLIPLLAIPLSLIGAVFIIQIFGFSLNLLTLLAIVLSVGLVVDDAIIMVENVERHIEEGKSPFDAAIDAARELIGPIISMTVTIVSVYVPIAFQGGLTGSLFREFAITLAGAIVVSAIVAVTLSPMLGSKLLQANKKMAGPLEAPFERFRDWYSAFVDATLRHKYSVYFLWFALTLMIVPLYVLSPKELAPTEDQGVIFGFVETPADATIDQSAFYAKQVNTAFQNVEETDFTFQVTFPTGGFAGMVTKPWSERERTVFQILPEVQASLSQVAGLNVMPATPPSLPGGSNFPVNFVILSTAPAGEIYNFASELQQAAAASGKFAFPPMLDMKYDQPNAQVLIDKDKVADYGLNLQTVTRDLAILLGGNYVNRFNMHGMSYRVIPQVQRSARLTPEDLKDLYISGPQGELIRLAEIASISDSTVPRSLNRFQQLNAVKLSGFPIVPLDDALQFMEQKSAEILPGNYSIDYTGESRQLRTEGNKFIPAISFATIIIFMVLAAQFNSFRDPLIILLGSVPMAIFGALVFTFLKSFMPHWTDGWTSTLNIYSQVGLVTLIGLIVRNGILVVEFANNLQEKGMSKLQAVKDASFVRLRPVLMTSIATIAGHTPLIFAAGAGAEARNSIGLVLVLGMAIGTLFSLVVLPAIYMLFARDFNQAKQQKPELEQAHA